MIQVAAKRCGEKLVLRRRRYREGSSGLGGVYLLSPGTGSAVGIALARDDVTPWTLLHTGPG